jgi:hypothetical protein
MMIEESLGRGAAPEEHPPEQAKPDAKPRRKPARADAGGRAGKSRAGKASLTGDVAAARVDVGVDGAEAAAIADAGAGPGPSEKAAPKRRGRAAKPRTKPPGADRAPATDMGGGSDLGMNCGDDEVGLS